VQAVRLPTLIEVTVIASDKQVRPSGDGSCLHRCDRHTDGSRQRHHQRFILRRVRVAADGWLQNVGGGLAGCWQGHAVADEHDWQLGLSAGEREPQSFTAGKHGPCRQYIQYLQQLRIGERARRPAVAGTAGASPSGQRDSAPATSPPNAWRNAKSLRFEMPRASAMASRCDSSGRRPAKNGRHWRCLKGSDRLGSENEIAAQEASASHSGE